MLALPSRRQHLQQYTTHPVSSTSQQLSYQQLPQQLASQQFFDEKLLNDYLESQQQSIPITSAPKSYMATAFDFANPAIRIQNPTPLPQNDFSQPPMLTNNAGLESWTSYPTQQQQMHASMDSISRGHQRAASSSSAASSGSHYQPAHSAGYQTFPNHLPTPTQTPTQDSFIAGTNFHNYTPTSAATMDQTMAAHMSAKQVLMEQSDDVPDFAHSARQSVSSYDSPATPHTALGEDLEFKASGNDVRQPTIPKFERSYTDIAADNFYDPSVVAVQSASQSKPVQSSMLSPYRNAPNETVQRALQAAQYARSQSPSSSASRGDSPFRRSSPYSQMNGYNAQMSGKAVSVRDQNTGFALKSQVRSNQEAQPSTISPKEAMLDYAATDDDSKASLFPDNSADEYEQQYRTATQSSFDSASAQSYRDDAWSTAQFPANFATSAAPSLPQAASFDFSTPQQLPMAPTSQYRPTAQRLMEQTPEFPAHLTSMESSASEAEPPSGSQGSDLYVRKPAATGADSGTYSCTYHGCSQRFETPQKLQKHKREGHRNPNLVAAATMTSAAILERNSQAGPHKCDRINPTTGKPCSTVFSRPYDLTRHEDTIHNARKQKVRCALCVEEKTFSRNDALTRHMRVVHPEVDFPGKHRRRGGHHD